MNIRIQVKKILGTTLTISCFVAITYYSTLVNRAAFPDALSVVAYPFLCFQHFMMNSVSSYADFFEDKKKLLDVIDNLKQERDLLREENILLHGTFSYYEDIHEIVAFKQRYNPTQGLVAQVLMRTMTDAGHSMLIDAGATQGVVHNMVALYKNCVVGVVEQVYPLYSKVRLVTDRRCKIAVYGAASRSHGIYEGTNSLDDAVVTYMSHLNVPVLHEELITSGQGLIYPQGFGVAQLVSYEREGLYYKVAAKPLADVSKIRYCVLVVPLSVE